MVRYLWTRSVSQRAHVWEGIRPFGQKKKVGACSHLILFCILQMDHGLPKALVSKLVSASFAVLSRAISLQDIQHLSSSQGGEERTAFWAKLASKKWPSPASTGASSWPQGRDGRGSGVTPPLRLFPPLARIIGAVFKRAQPSRHDKRGKSGSYVTPAMREEYGAHHS